MLIAMRCLFDELTTMPKTDSQIIHDFDQRPTMAIDVVAAGRLDLSNYSQLDLEAVARQLNERPTKTLIERKESVPDD